MLVPDLAGWRRDRMPELPMAAAAFELAPDWVCEIVPARTGATCVALGKVNPPGYA